MSLEGKIAFITGAGSGIGRATAQLLASQGAKVAAADLRADTAGEIAAAIVASGTHLKGTFLCCQAAVKQMIRQKCGRIVNIVSGIAVNAARRGSAYSAAKGGIMSFIKSLALEVREHGIMVNALSPGPTRTPMSSWGSAKPGDASYAEMISQHPQGLKEPKQAAQYIATLAGPLFDHTTGRIMHF